MNISARLSSLFKMIKWGDWCLICLYISLVSGIIVGLQYDVAEPFYSTAALDALTPFGFYFRSLHFYSSQLFFLLAIAHYLSVFNKAESLDTKRWTYLILTLPVALILLFTGYVLRGDATGTSAGMIAEHILISVPIIGGTLNNFLFSITDHGMQRVYMHHVISFDLLFLLFAWDHLRKYRIKMSNYLFFTTIVLVFSVFVSAPLDSEELGIFYVTGPWFFLGLQELLRYLPPFIAGFLIPVFMILSIILLRKRNRSFYPLLVFVIIWLTGYLLLTILALTTHS